MFLVVRSTKVRFIYDANPIPIGRAPPKSHLLYLEVARRGGLHPAPC